MSPRGGYRKQHTRKRWNRPSTHQSNTSALAPATLITGGTLGRADGPSPPRGHLNMPSQLDETGGIAVDVRDGAEDGGCDYVEMSSASCSNTNTEYQLTPFEIARIRHILNSSNGSTFRDHQQHQQLEQEQCESILGQKSSVESEQTEFRQSTHSLFLRKESDNSDGSEKIDRVIGAIVISFQMFTYYLFAAEAIEDYQKGAVDVFTTHDNCIDSGYMPQQNFLCETEKTYLGDAFVSFFMLSIFLASDFQQAFRSIKKAWSNSWLTLLSAFFVALEVFCAFLAASISISQKLYIGEVTDAIEAGVGLLFIRELSTRAYQGMRQKKKKAYWSFFFVLVVTIVLGMLVHPACEALLAP